MRVISGIYKNRNLATPGEGTHPMGARERLAVFNILAPFLAGARVLDAFAGSGALGIEALSRGAEFVTFVEKNPRAARIIRENLATLGVPRGKYEVITADVEKVKFLADFDIILADPPYDKFEISAVSNLVRVLKTEGIFVLSHPSMEKIEISGLKLEKSRKYAASNIDFFGQV